jgi:hypothetical protein
VRATWAVSTPRARTWVSGDCGEDGADRAGPSLSERESAGERSTALMRRAHITHRERERDRESGHAREGSGADRSAPLGRGREGARVEMAMGTRNPIGFYLKRPQSSGTQM